MSTMGAKIQSMPDTAASLAAIFAASSNSAGFQVQASASGMGKIVLCPWITSNPTISGIPSRLSSTAVFCRRLTSKRSGRLRIEPTCPARTRSCTSGVRTDCTICPTFSSRVIWSRSAVTFSSISGDQVWKQ